MQCFKIFAAMLALDSIAAIAAETPQVLDAVVVHANYDDSIGSSDASSQGVINAELIKNRPTLRGGEILEFVPGLIVTQHSGDGKANQYFLRGFNLDHGTDFATYFDEMPVNMRSHAHGQGYTDINFIIPELVQQIEYKKGPYFADEGDFSSAGAAHLQLQNELKKGFVKATVGEDQYARLTTANSNNTEAGKFLYGFSIAHNNGPWVNPENFHNTNALIRYSNGSAKRGFSLTGMAYSAKWNSTDQIPLRAVEEGLIDRFGSLSPTDGGETSRYSLSYQFHQRNGSTLFQANIYVIKSGLDLFSDFTYFQEHPIDLGDAIDGDQFHQSERRNVAGVNISQTWFGKLVDFNTENTIGLQTRTDKVSPLALYSSVAREKVATTLDDTVKENSLAAYWQNTLYWSQNFRTIAGVRFDEYHFNVASDIAENSGTVKDHIVSPKISAIFGPFSKTEFFLNYGQGFHSNDARGATETMTPKERIPTDPVTPLVKTSGSELGIRSEIINGLQTSFALWQLKIDSELTFSGDAGDTEASSPSKRYGIEWNNHYRILPGFLFDANLSASRARFTALSGDEGQQGFYIPGSVDRVASLGLTYDSAGPWLGALELRYFGPRPLIEDNSKKSKATNIAYLRAGYKYTPNTQLTIDVFNIFNRKFSDIDYYYSSRLQGEPTEGVNDIHFHPVEPRTVRVSIQTGL